MDNKYVSKFVNRHKKRHAKEQELIELTFNTDARGQDIKKVHLKIMDLLTAISGFKKKIHQSHVEIISDRKGKMKFLLKQSPETAMQNPAIKVVLHLLQNDKRINTINLDQLERSSNTHKRHQSNHYHNSYQEKKKKQHSVSSKVHKETTRKFLELRIRTKGSGIDAYHRKLFKRAMKIPGFEAKVYDYEMKTISMVRGLMRFVLAQSSGSAMDDPAICGVLGLLQSQERVDKIDLDECTMQVNKQKFQKSVKKMMLMNKFK